MAFSWPFNFSKLFFALSFVKYLYLQLMGYLRYFDYYMRAQDANIQQWIASNMLILAQAENVAEQELRGYLVQKFEVDEELTDTTIFANSAIYKANARVELNFNDWVAGIYAVGAYVKYTDGKVYRCIQVTTNQIPTNASYWAVIGDNFEMFYLQYPYDVFSQSGTYQVGDKVFWKDKIYQCVIATQPVGHDEALQAVTYSNLRARNVYPDDRLQGVTYWGAGVAYSVTGLIPNYTAPSAWDDVTAYTIGTRVLFDGVIWKAIAASTDIEPGSNINKWQSETWVSGDSRDALMVRCIVDLTIWSIMPRIAPRSIPTKQKENYEWSKQWLLDIAAGNFTPKLPAKQENKGNRIRWGGNIKQSNGY